MATDSDRPFSAGSLPIEPPDSGHCGRSDHRRSTARTDLAGQSQVGLWQEPFVPLELRRTPSIEKISVALPPEMVAAAKGTVEAGEYSSNSEVVRDALRHWTLKRSAQQHALEELRRVWQEARQDARPSVPRTIAGPPRTQVPIVGDAFGVASVMRVELSAFAESDLEGIADYIAQNSPARAVDFVRKVREKFTAIGDSPSIYRLRAEIGEGAAWRWWDVT